MFKKAILPLEELKRFVRGDISFAQLSDTARLEPISDEDDAEDDAYAKHGAEADHDVDENDEDDEYDFVIYECEEEYQITLEEVVNTLRRAVAEARPLGDFMNDWYLNICYTLWDAVGLEHLLGEMRCELSGTADDSHYSELEPPRNSETGAQVFCENEHDLAVCIFDELDNLHDSLELEDDSKPQNSKPQNNSEQHNNKPATEIKTVASHPLITQLIQLYDNFFLNQGKPHDEWVLVLFQKDRIVDYLFEHDRIDQADEVDQRLYKRLTLELANENNVTGLKALGYGCYGDDSPVFDCDWNVSRDCMLKLMDVAPDQMKAQAANTLGYIYYYGRCNGGQPQYEEAYRFFSMAAFYGFFEATYKVGDMLRDGKGIFKNEEAAFRLYNSIYEENLNKFLSDDDSVVADIALRLGSCYQHGVGVRANLFTAYEYYMLANLAIEDAMKRSHFFGHSTVAAHIKKGLGEVKRELGEQVEHSEILIDVIHLVDLKMLQGDATSVGVRIVPAEGGYDITFTRIGGHKLLITLAPVSYCEKCSSLTLFVPDNMIEYMPTERGFTIDSVQESDDGEVSFLYEGKLMLRTNDFDWIFKASKKNTTGTMHKFVSVQFAPGGRTYDYLCDGMDIQPGDEVIVPGLEGLQHLTAIAVHEQAEEDLPIDISRYKRVERA